MFDVQNRGPILQGEEVEDMVMGALVGELRGIVGMGCQVLVVGAEGHSSNDGWPAMVSDEDICLGLPDELGAAGFLGREEHDGEGVRGRLQYGREQMSTPMYHCLSLHLLSRQTSHMAARGIKHDRA